MYKVVENSQPWYHLVIDNFLPDSIFNIVIRYSDYNWTKNTGNKMREFASEQDLKILDNFAVQNIWPIISKYYDDPTDVNGMHDHRLSWLLPGTSHSGGVHDEEINKHHSVVVYILPTELNNGGTELYSDYTSFDSRVEWKQNRAMIFKGKEGITFHNYQNVDQHKTRFTYNYFWRDKDKPRWGKNSY